MQHPNPGIEKPRTINKQMEPTPTLEPEALPNLPLHKA
jgi:hypothetical protein